MCTIAFNMTVMLLSCTSPIAADDEIGCGDGCCTPEEHEDQISNRDTELQVSHQDH